jgi:hypothetical protein
MKRHPFALAFSERRMSQPDSNVRHAPTPPNTEEEVYVRITPKGRARLAAINAASGIIAQKKELMLARLREDGGEPCFLQNVCHRADVTIEEAMLLIFELNSFCLRAHEAPADKPFISLFFNGHSGEVWAELYEPDGAECAR